MIDINNINDNSYYDGYKEIYEMMDNSYKKSLEMDYSKMEYSKIDMGNESGSISDKTLIMDDLDTVFSGKKRRNAILFDSQMGDIYTSLNSISNSYSQKKLDQNNTKLETGMDKSKHKGIENISSVIDNELNELDYLLSNKATEVTEGEEEEDTEDYNNNGILYMPKKIKSGLCLSPLKSKIKINVEHLKKRRSDGSKIDQKLRKQKVNEIPKEKSSRTKDETKRFSKKVEDANVLNQYNNVELTNTHHHQIKHSASIKSNKSNRSDKSFTPQVPPRGISKIHMKNRLKRNVKSEDNLCKINIQKPVKANDNNTNSFNSFLSKNEKLKSLSLPKNIKNEEDLNIYLKRKYRESKIKILYRNDYYMQELDDKDYEDYDKALFDEQLFINVENNETDCSDTIVNEPSSSSLSNMFDLISSSSPKDDTTANLIAKGYHHIVEKNEKNLKETSLIGEHDKKHRNKYHHYGATNDSYDLDDTAPTRSVSLSSIQTISKSKLNIYPKNRSLSTSNLKSSTNTSTNNVSYITGSSLKHRSSLKSKKKRNHQSSISNKSSSTESICAKLSDYYKEYNSNDRWAYQNHEGHYYPYQAPTHNDYQKPVYTVEEEKENEIDNDNNSVSSSSSISSYLSSLSSDSSSITRIPSDKNTYNYNHNPTSTYIFPYTTGMDIHAYY